MRRCYRVRRWQRPRHRLAHAEGCEEAGKHTLLSVFFIHVTCCSGVASMNSLVCFLRSSCHPLASVCCFAAGASLAECSGAGVMMAALAVAAGCQGRFLMRQDTISTSRKGASRTGLMLKT